MKKMFIALFFIAFSTPLLGVPITWATPSTLSTLGVNSLDPHVAFDSSGNIVAVWNENGVIKASTQPVSGNWGTAVAISSSGASAPRLFVDPSGNATAIWIDSGGVKAATLPSGGSWSAATSVSLAGASTPQLAGDHSGNVVAIWESSGGGIQSATKSFGGSGLCHY